MTDTKKIQENTAAFREGAARLADRVDHVAVEMSVAKRRLGRRLDRALAEVAELGKDAERPARSFSRAMDDLGYEARRAFERIVRPPRDSFLERLMFWR